MWSRRTTNLGVRRCRTLFAHAFLLAGLCASAALGEVANEDRALRQALTIVQLLRAEYSRLVPSSTETPAPTCAPTTSDLPSQSNPSRRYWARYNKPVPRRRMDYDDGFGAHPPNVETSKTTPTTISELPPSSSQKNSDNAATPASVVSSPVTQSPIPTTPSTLPSSAFSSAKSVPRSSTPVASDRNSVSTHLPSPAIALQSTITRTTVGNFKLTAVVKPAVTPTPKPGGLATKDVSDTPSPELQQVAVELAGELQESDAKPPNKLKLKLEEPTMVRQTARPTWREYLPHSTRYSVPLPENHAFCYTDPNNALCRTFI